MKLQRFGLSRHFAWTLTEDIRKGARTEHVVETTRDRAGAIQTYWIRLSPSKESSLIHWWFGTLHSSVEFQISHGAQFRPPFKCINQDFYSGCMKNVMLIKCVRRTFRKTVAVFNALAVKGVLGHLNYFPQIIFVPDGPWKNASCRLFSVKMEEPIVQLQQIAPTGDNAETLAAHNSSAHPQNKRLSVERIYQKKTQLEHILLRPDSYIGSTERNVQSMWVMDEEKQCMVYRDILFSPGLYKIFDEILVNAADNKVRDPTMTCVKVDIEPEQNMIKIWNNGKGIPVVQHKVENVYVPTLIFGHLLTSSNYDDTERKVTGGRNGYGAKLCNIFSKKFIVETSSKDYKKSFRQVWTDNMTKTSDPKISPDKGDDFTCITFYPDLQRFGMTELDSDTVALFVRRAYDLAATTSGVKVFLNGKRLAIKSFMDYVDLYVKANKESETTPKVVFEGVNPRWQVAVAPSGSGFQQVSFVNGIATTKGGKHVDYIADQLNNKLIEIVKKKSGKSGVQIKPFQIKNHMWLFVNCLIENPTFDSQTKENMTLQPKSFGSTCTLSEKFVTQASKCGIVESVLSWVRFKAMEKLDKQCHKAKHVKLKGIPKLDDANNAGTKHSNQCTLILTEGDSAKSLAVAGLGVVGRDNYGVFPLRGKLLNVREASSKQIMDNAEINALIKIMGLQYKHKYENPESLKDLRYGKIMIMTDQDQDGSHIKGLIINFVHCNWPNLLKHNVLEEFITPIVKVFKGKDELSFYSLPEFEEWQRSTTNWHTWRIKYYKGLGTSSGKEAKQYFSDMIRHRIRFRYTGSEDDASIQLAFDRSKASERKNWLTSWTMERKRRRELSLPEPYLYGKDTRAISYHDFVHKELVLFSNLDNERSIPSMVLFTCLKRNLVKEIKVAQLAGSVAELSAYHHGEQSLLGTIVGLAQNFVVVFDCIAVCIVHTPFHSSLLIGFTFFQVLFTCLKRNLVKEIKVAQLAGSVAELSAYHHGEQSLLGTIVGLAQNFVGSNNLNVLLPIGQFGTRLSGGKDAASARYIFTALSPLTRLIFHPADDPLLNYLRDDNQRIEPEWYAPIVPMVLINGAEGIGTGYSTRIPNYNVLEVISNLYRLLDGEDTLPMLPSFRGFCGTIQELEANRYMIHGEVAVLDDDTIEITELPVRTWTQTYKETVLEPMLNGTDKVQPCITDYKEYHTDTTVRFVVKMSAEKLREAEAIGLHKFFKLSSALTTNSMVLFDQLGCLKHYRNVDLILREFFDIRLQWYEKRKSYLEGMLAAEARKLENQARFVLEKIQSQISIENKPRKELIQILKSAAYDSDPVRAWKECLDKLASLEEEMESGSGEPTEQTESGGPDYNYILGMPLWSLTKERKDDLLAQRDAKQNELRVLRSKTASMLWRDDLQKLEEAYKKFEADLAAEEAAASAAASKKLLKAASTGVGRAASQNLSKRAQETKPDPFGRRIAPVIDPDLLKKLEANRKKQVKANAEDNGVDVSFDDDADLEFDDLDIGGSGPPKPLLERLSSGGADTNIMKPSSGEATRGRGRGRGRATVAKPREPDRDYVFVAVIGCMPRRVGFLNRCEGNHMGPNKATERLRSSIKVETVIRLLTLYKRYVDDVLVIMSGAVRLCMIIILPSLRNTYFGSTWYQILTAFPSTGASPAKKRQPGQGGKRKPTHKPWEDSDSDDRTPSSSDSQFEARITADSPVRQRTHRVNAAKINYRIDDEDESGTSDDGEDNFRVIDHGPRWLELGCMFLWFDLDGRLSEIQFHSARGPQTPFGVWLVYPNVQSLFRHCRGSKPTGRGGATAGRGRGRGAINVRVTMPAGSGGGKQTKLGLSKPATKKQTSKKNTDISDDDDAPSARSDDDVPAPVPREPRMNARRAATEKARYVFDLESSEESDNPDLDGDASSDEEVSRKRPTKGGKRVHKSDDDDFVPDSFDKKYVYVMDLCFDEFMLLYRFPAIGRTRFQDASIAIDLTSPPRFCLRIPELSRLDFLHVDSRFCALVTYVKESRGTDIRRSVYIVIDRNSESANRLSAQISFSLLT
ncbi:DNA topoisomerase II [Clonorchis sinensis]|uniref:DNA topoisomerase (ATP-hydrolyzing) n=1 Tax=Clonorchis sinensis TaxID=79923 RepID=G7YSI2_CLOSI|nr:DNA topoisomerase II [Clonorchis sinensis]